MKKFIFSLNKCLASLLVFSSTPNYKSTSDVSKTITEKDNYDVFCLVRDEIKLLGESWLFTNSDDIGEIEKNSLIQKLI